MKRVEYGRRAYVDRIELGRPAKVNASRRRSCEFYGQGHGSPITPSNPLVSPYYACEPCIRYVCVGGILRDLYEL
eukprot:COSAG05_NODE_1734_length_4177_cov_22.454144_2_plen_75_part_00